MAILETRVSAVERRVLHDAGLKPWQYRVDARTIMVGCDLQVIRLRSAGGQDIGVLVGFPLPLAAAALTSDRVLVIPETDVAQAWIAWIHHAVAGRYVIILQDRIALDPSGSFPCVYGPVERVAGLDPLSIMSEVAFDRRQIKTIVRGSDWFPGGLTGHQGVSRLMPNHVLDLGSFAQRRDKFATGLPTAKSAQEAAHDVIASVRAQIAALLDQNKRPALALTAGRDSRLIMVAARPFRKDVSFFTISDKRSAIDTDTQCARAMAEALDLNWFELPRVLATAEEKARYLRQTGHVVAGASSRIWPSLRPLYDQYAFVGGTGGEIGRGFYFKPSDQWVLVNAVRLGSRMGLPQDDDIMLAVETWLAGLSPRDAHHILDLAYLELREGCMNGAQLPGDQTIPRYLPLMSRQAIDSMLSLSVRDKTSNALPAAAIAMHWPEAGRFPFNSLGMMRNTLAQTRRVLKDPQVVLVKLRKMFS